MANSAKRSPAFLSQEPNRPVATFKNSLRLWQARYRAQQTAGGAEAVLPQAAKPGDSASRDSESAD
jgi:hypothetical protein